MRIRALHLPTALIIGFGGLLLAGHFAIQQISADFIYGQAPWISPTKLYIGLAMAMGAGLLTLLWAVPRIPSNRRLLVFIFAIGLAARGLMFFSMPVLEDDWHRYLWDGGALANGVDPYKYSPAQSAAYDAFGVAMDPAEEADLARLQELAAENPILHYRINYPYVKTIYPPIAEAAFALAYLIEPYSLTSWRFVLLLVDTLSFGLCLLALRAHGRSALWSALYWWNPIITLEVFNAGHMDVLIVPFLFSALWLARTERRGWAAAALAGAAAVKIWPALLMPALVRPLLSRPWQLVGAGAIFGATAVLLLAPQLAHLTDPSQGLSVYSAGWRRNAFLYSVLVEGPLSFLQTPETLARFIMAGLTGLLALWFAWRAPKDGSRTAAAMLAAAGALVFLSPTGYPWYLTWIAPFLAFAPRVGFVALPAMGPLYYTRFLMGDQDPLYQWGIVPVAFGVPLLLLALGAVWPIKTRTPQYA